MKKKIISIALACLLLVACFAPLALAACENSNTAHTAFHSAVDSLKEVVQAQASGDINKIWYSGASNPFQIAVDTVYSKISDAAPSAGELWTLQGEDDYEYYMSIVNKLSARETAYNTYISRFTICSSYEGTPLANTDEHRTAYNNASAAYNALMLGEKNYADSFNKDIADLAVPEDLNPTGNSYIVAIESVTTLTALKAAVSAAVAAKAANPSLFTSTEAGFLTESQSAVSFLELVAAYNKKITSAATIPAEMQSILNAYNVLGSNAKDVVSQISVESAKYEAIEMAREIAVAYKELGSSYGNIVTVYNDFIAFTQRDTYFDSSFNSAITNLYTTFLDSFDKKITTRYNSINNTMEVTVAIEAGKPIQNAVISITTTSTLVSLASINGVSYNENAYYSAFGGTATAKSISGGYTVTVNGGVSQSGSVTFVYKVLAIGAVTASFSVNGSVNSKVITPEVVTSTSCTHKNSSGKMTLTVKNIIAPTCSVEGNAGYFCTTCGSRVLQKEGAPNDVVIVARTAHTYGTKKVVNKPNVAATCTTPGKQYFECSVCKSVIDTYITQPAKHTVDTSTIYYSNGAWYAKCSVCKQTINFSAEAAKCTCETTYGGKYHTVTSSKVASCGENGYSVVSCELCGLNFIETLAASSGSHSFGAWTTVTQATCTTDGSQKRVCSACGKEETQTVNKLGHTAGANVTVVTPSTCTVQGTGNANCGVCGVSMTVALPLADHTYDGGVITLAPTCTSTGIKNYTCSACGNKKSETAAIDPAAHSYGDYTIVTESTCLTDGVKTHTCTYCSNVETVTDEATGHKWGAEKVSGKTTTKTCSDCGVVWSKTVKGKKTTLALTALNSFTLNVTDGVVANKDIAFVVKSDEAVVETYKAHFDSAFDEEKYDRTMYGAYKAYLVTADNSASVGKGTDLVIDLGENYAKKEILVKYIDGNAIVNVEAERDGSSIVIDGEDFAKFADKTFVVLTSNKKAGSTSIVVPIIICVVIVAIAGVAVVLVLRQKNGRENLF